jgi:hypothetical protein
MAHETLQHGWRAASRAASKVPLYAILVVIRAYRLALSPLLGPHCRFQPTCSAYALEALTRHGLVKGGWLALKRLARCHPVSWLGSGHGFDPVPHAHSASKMHVGDV